jgi:catechol 2,3-dioxygenase-like lactoylglutathione lyase family enzyme
MILKKIDSVAIWSENWRELADWYKGVFGLEENMTLDLPDDTGTNLKVGDGSVLFWFGYHDRVKGKTKEPFRIMVAFEVEDVFETFKVLKEKDVKFIAMPQLSPTKDFHFATMQDPDGNTINLYSFNLDKNE